MEKELTEIIMQLKNITDKLGMDITEETIFKESCSFTRRNYIGQKKFNQNYNKENKPTEKQIFFLNKNKINIPETKQEAFILIQEKINKSKND